MTERDDHDEIPTRVHQAVRLLTQEVRDRLDRHPWGHLLAGRRDTLPVTLALPTLLRERTETLRGLTREASEALDGVIQALLTHRATIQPGAVFCLRCETAQCDHAMPTGPRQVFAGYGKTGIPRFEDFGQLLLELQDSRVDRLFGASPEPLTRTFSARELTAGLLPAFRKGERGYRIHGQVAAGWFAIPDPSGRPHTLAVTLQVVSTRAEGAARRRFSLNVLGLGPEGEPLEHLYDRLPEVPWRESVLWAQRILDSMSRPGKGGKARKGSKHLKKRIDGMLASISRRLERKRRSKERKTHHARERHAQGDRPTPMALPDLARATGDQILVDVRAETLVVLGDKGRAHVFSPEGKLVTSVRYNPASIERRRERGHWRPAQKEEAQALRAAVAGQGEDH